MKYKYKDVENVSVAITRFRGEHFYLSNYYEVLPTLLEYKGRKSSSTEAAFQAAKCAFEGDANLIAGMRPNDAKRNGRQVVMRADWDTVRIIEMYQIVKAKFEQNPDLAEKLIATGNALLVEGNNWHDTFWGVDVKDGGENHLGEILMQVRRELRGEPDHC